MLYDDEIISVLYRYNNSDGKYYLKVQDGKLILEQESYWHQFKEFFTSSDKKEVCDFLNQKVSNLVDYEMSLLLSEKFSEAKEFKSIINTLFEEAGKTQDTPDINKEYYSNWMKYLPNEAKEVTITQLTLPGTHDSSSYTVNFDLELSESNKLGNKILDISDYFLGFTKDIFEDKIIDWTITQHQTIKEQLESGIRYLDLRVAYNPNDGKFYGAHTFLNAELDVILQDIADFMKEHPEDIVVIKLSKEYENRLEFTNNSQLTIDVMTMFEEKLGSWLYENNSSGIIDSNITLNNMVEADKRVLVFSSDFGSKQNDLYNKYAFLWDGKKIYIGNDSYLPSTDEEKLDNFEYFMAKLDKSQVNENKFNALSLVITPDKESIKDAILEGNMTLYDFEIEMNETLVEYLATHKEKLKKISIVTADFPEDTDLVSTIVQSNHERFHDYTTYETGNDWTEMMVGKISSTYYN